MPKEKEVVKQKDTELESKLEKQSKDLWAIKDQLRERVSTAQMRELLTANNQDATGSEYDLRERWLVPSCVYYCPYTLVSYLVTTRLTRSLLISSVEELKNSAFSKFIVLVYCLYDLCC